MNNYNITQNIICYFDILGYKQLLYELGEDMFIHYVACVMDTIKEQLNNYVVTKLQYHIFSDNVIIFSPISDSKETNEILMVEYLTFIAILQRNLMGQYGIFLRGCITIGNLYYSGDFIYGSGLIHAYKLENNIAIYPRIIIDKICVNILPKDSMLFNLSTRRYIVRDDAGMYFINYLFGFNKPLDWNIDIKDICYDKVISTEKYNNVSTPFSSLPFSEDELLKPLLEYHKSQHQGFGVIYLVLHKILVERNIKKYKGIDERCYIKYNWCRNYHNKVCKQNNIPELYVKNND